MTMTTRKQDDDDDDDDGDDDDVQLFVGHPKLWVRAFEGGD